MNSFYIGSRNGLSNHKFHALFPILAALRHQMIKPRGSFVIRFCSMCFIQREISMFFISFYTFTPVIILRLCWVLFQKYLLIWFQALLKQSRSPQNFNLLRFKCNINYFMSTSKGNISLFHFVSHLHGFQCNGVEKNSTTNVTRCLFKPLIKILIYFRFNYLTQ